MTIHHRDCAPQYQTKDTSLIREIVHPNHSAARNQSLAEAQLAPGAKTEAHFHPQSEEIYYVLRGTAELSLDGDVSTLHIGDAIVIPPGTPHQIRNIGDKDLVFLCCCAPPYSHDDTVLCDDLFATISEDVLDEIKALIGLNPSEIELILDEHSGERHAVVVDAQGVRQRVPLNQESLLVYQRVIRNYGIEAKIGFCI